MLFLSDLGLSESGLDRLIQAGYELLGLISYLTAGNKAPGGLPLLQVAFQPPEDLRLLQGLFIPPLAGLKAPVDAPLHQLQVGKNQLQLDGFNIPPLTPLWGAGPRRPITPFAPSTPTWGWCRFVWLVLAGCGRGEAVPSSGGGPVASGAFSEPEKGDGTGPKHRPIFSS